LVDTEKVKVTDNFQKLSYIEKNLEEFLDIEYAYFGTSSASISHKIANRKATNNFNIEEAVLYFNQPVSVVLENNKNDSQFIRAIITHFGKIDERNKALEHLNFSWLQFENAGGCSNILNFITEFLERFRTIADKNQRQMSDYFRGIIIIDSDKEFATQESKHTGLIEKWKSKGIASSQIHVLQKRALENYLPKEVFEEIRRQPAVRNNNALNDWLEAYLSLTDKDQLDYLNIADGFPPKKDKYDISGTRKSVNPEILSMFALSVTDINFKKLDNGFKYQGLDENGKLKSGSSFKDEFPNLFRKPIINKQSLEARDGNGELLQIASKINQLL
jgi:hypothetical protein